MLFRTQSERTRLCIGKIRRCSLRAYQPDGACHARVRLRVLQSVNKGPLVPVWLPAMCRYRTRRAVVNAQHWQKRLPTHAAACAVGPHGDDLQLRRRVYADFAVCLWDNTHSNTAASAWIARRGRKYMCAVLSCVTHLR